MNYYFRKDTLMNFVRFFLMSFGTIWLFIEFPSSLNTVIKEFFNSFGNLTLIISSILSIFFGFFRILPSKKINRKFAASNTSVEITVGDIFNERGNFAIGSSNYFDTNFEISNLSLKSQLINRCFNSDTENIDRLIDQSLTEQGVSGIIDTAKTVGKQKKFPIGTTVKLNQSNRHIFILVISELIFEQGRKHTISNPKLLNDSLSEFWSFIKTEGRMKEITIPVFGSGLARVNLSYRLLIQMIVLSFVTYSKSTRITEQLKIMVHEKDYNPEDFEELNKFLKSIEI